MSDLDRPGFDMFAANSTDGDEYSRLFLHKAEQIPEAVAQCGAEQEARDATQATEHDARQVRQADRKAAEEKEAAERETLERARCEGMAAEREVQIAASEALRAARRQQDDDYHAWEFQLCFRIDGASCAAGIDEETNPALWELNEDVVANFGMIKGLKTEIITALEPWVSHYRSLGLARADFASFAADRERGDGLNGPMFFLIHSAADAVFSPDSLGRFPDIKIDLATLPGASLTVSAVANPTNATLLHSTAQCGGLGVNHWGGEETPDMAPAPDESRAEWLERVCLPGGDLKRIIAKWQRSGGRLELYEAAGAATARVSKERPISWIIPGLIPRGYVSLLVGTKQAGKSTLLGEIIAVVDSECQTSRSVLGTVVEARGPGCLVSGEDGIDFVSSRNAHYEPIHGEAQGYVFVTAERPWPEVLKLLYAIQKVDIIGIDGLRAVMPGDEDSSGAISQFFDELNTLAQFHNCAIILVHHLSKGAVRFLSAMLPAVRGSGAITDRVRAAIGMIDRGSGITEVGIIKHNFPPSEPLWGQVNAGRLFRRDAATLTLERVEAAVRLVGSTSSDDANALTAIWGAIEHHNGRNEVLRRTGRHALFERKWPPLAMFSRKALEEGVTALTAAGRVTDGADGLIAIRADMSKPSE